MRQPKDPKSTYEVFFDEAPPSGSVIKFDGHPFTVADVVPYVRRDGTETPCILWNSECVDCGEPIEVKTVFKSKTITKRCALHKRRGVPATKAAMDRMLTRRGRQKAKTKG